MRGKGISLENRNEPCLPLIKIPWERVWLRVKLILYPDLSRPILTISHVEIGVRDQSQRKWLELEGPTLGVRFWEVSVLDASSKGDLTVLRFTLHCLAEGEIIGGIRLNVWSEWHYPLFQFTVNSCFDDSLLSRTAAKFSAKLTEIWLNQSPVITDFFRYYRPTILDILVLLSLRRTPWGTF